MSNENIKFPFNIIKNHDVVKTFCALASILTGAFYAIFKFFYYWVERSYLAFWHLPKEFIHSNSNSFIYELITTAIAVSIIFFFSYCFYQLKKETINALKINEIKKKCIKDFCTYLIRFLFLIAIILFYASLFHTLFYLYIKGTTGLSLSYSSILSDTKYTFILLFFAALCSTITYLIGFLCSPMNKNKQNAESNKAKEFKHPKLYFCSLILLVIIFSILSFLSTYNSYIEQYQSTTAFDTIENSDNVVLYKDTDNFVVKEYFIIDETIYINRDTYQIINAKNLPIKTITLTKTSSEPVFRIIPNEDFQDLIKETNSNEDTPS